MATPAQAAAATVGAGSLAAAGSYGITYAVNSGNEENNEKEMNDFSDAEKELLREPINPTTFKLTTGVTALATEYQKKILDVTKNENLENIVKGSVATNQEWWKWAYKNKFLKATEEQKDSIFQNINTDFDASENNANALNQACEKAYKTDKAKFSEDNNNLVSNIGSFCTKGARKVDISEPKATVIKTIDTTYQNKLAGTGDNKDKLVKVKSTNGTENYNDHWWKWAFKNRFPKTDQEKNQLASIFQKVTQGYLETAAGSDGSKTSLNHACDEAYKKNNTDLGSDKTTILRDTKRFCTLTGNDSLQEPSS